MVRIQAMPRMAWFRPIAMASATAMPRGTETTV